MKLNWPVWLEGVHRHANYGPDLNTKRWARKVMKRLRRKPLAHPTANAALDQLGVGTERVRFRNEYEKDASWVLDVVLPRFVKAAESEGSAKPVMEGAINAAAWLKSEGIKRKDIKGRDKEITHDYLLNGRRRKRKRGHDAP